MLSFKRDTYDTFKENLELLRDDHKRNQDVMRYRVSLLRGDIKPKSFAVYNVASCISEAIISFNDLNGSQYELPEFNSTNDFIFLGSNKHLIQALMSLFSYSFTQRGSEEFKRKIWLGKNEIHYSYEGKAVSPSELTELFSYPLNPKKSLSNPHYVDGIGILYYVRKVIESFGGDIVCDSTVKKGIPRTHFTLFFPKIRKNG